MPHRRTKKVKVVRRDERVKLLEARRLVLATAFRDVHRAETVSRIDMPEVDTDPGDVVLDNRGNGSYQTF
jgi:uncharacterized protein (UPF0264 family)